MDTMTHTPTQQAWRDAIAIVTLRAKDKMGAAYHGRLDKAQALVLDHKVAPYADGHGATVMSETDADKAYDVNGACECRDAQTKAPEGWCKHKLAVAIYRRAVEHGQELLVARTEPLARSNGVSSSEPEFAGCSPLPEAPVSVTLKGTVRGCPGTLVTVRGTTLAEVQAQLDAAAALFDAAPAASTGQAVERRTGYTPDDEEQLPYCPKHGVHYRKQTKNGQSWYSHRLADDNGWCRYKGKR